MSLKEEAECPLQTDDESQATDEQNLGFRGETGGSLKRRYAGLVRPSVGRSVRNAFVNNGGTSNLVVIK